MAASGDLEFLTRDSI